MGKKLKPDGGRLRSLYPMYWSLRKKKEEKGYVQDLEINALSFKNQRGLKYQIQTTKIRQSPQGIDKTELHDTPTDRQTHRQRDRQTDKKPIKSTYGQTNK